MQMQASDMVCVLPVRPCRVVARGVRRAARLIRRRHGRRAWRAIEWEWVRGRLHAPAPGIGRVLLLSRARRLYRRSLPLPVPDPSAESLLMNAAAPPDGPLSRNTR